LTFITVASWLIFTLFQASLRLYEGFSDDRYDEKGKGISRKVKIEIQPACAGDIERLRTTKLFIPASRQETRSSGASNAPLKWIQIVSLFRYSTSLVVALAGGLAYYDPDRIC
jgi:hypothetical protein